MNSRVYEVDGNKIIITDNDKHMEEIAAQIISGLKSSSEKLAIAADPNALSFLETYAANGEKLLKANTLLRETLKSQEVVLKFITKLDVDNSVKAAIPAVKQFKELKALLDTIVFPPITDNLKKVLTPSMITTAATLNTQKADILQKFNVCVNANATIEKCARIALANRKANTMAKAAGQVQPAPVNNANPPGFMHSNAKAADAAKAAAKPGVQPLPPNNNQKQK
jgi:hypothetical protein